MADSGVQKAIMASCFEVAETQLRGETRPSLSSLLHALKRQQYGLLPAFLGCIIIDNVVSYYSVTPGGKYIKTRSDVIKLSWMKKNDNVECSRVFI